MQSYLDSGFMQLWLEKGRKLDPFYVKDQTWDLLLILGLLYGFGYCPRLDKNSSSASNNNNKSTEIFVYCFYVGKLPSSAPYGTNRTVHRRGLPTLYLQGEASDPNLADHLPV